MLPVDAIISLDLVHDRIVQLTARTRFSQLVTSSSNFELQGQSNLSGSHPPVPSDHVPLNVIIISTFTLTQRSKSNLVSKLCS